MTVNRRTLLTGAAGVAAAAAMAGPAAAQHDHSEGALPAPAAEAGPRRNVLLIISDDQGLDAGCYGGPVKTPNIDALAAAGTRFDNGFCTVSSCSPSRSVLYTGLYSHTNGMYGLSHDVHNQSLLDGVQTLPMLLKQAGYATALVGKKHVRPDAAFAYDQELAPELPGSRDVSVMAHEMGRFIKSLGAGQPFFVTVGYSDPHRAAVNFGNTQKWPDVERVTYDPAAVAVPSHLPDTVEVRQDLAAYYESVSRLDAGIGLLLQALASAGHADDTLVIYLSDNGRPFPGAKTTFYDPGVHLPLVIRAPGQKGGAVSKAMVSWIDITPTILDFAGARGPHYRLPGRSLLPILNAENPAGWDQIFASHQFHEINQYYPMRLIRTRRWAYISNLAWEQSYPIAGDVASSPSWKAVQAVGRLGKRPLPAYLRRPAEELYDLAADPDQLVNLAADKRHAATLDEMRKRLTDWRAATSDPWLSGQTSPFGHHH